MTILKAVLRALAVAAPYSCYAALTDHDSADIGGSAIALFASLAVAALWSGYDAARVPFREAAGTWSLTALVLMVGLTVAKVAQEGLGAEAAVLAVFALLMIAGPATVGIVIGGALRPSTSPPQHPGGPARG